MLVSLGQVRQSLGMRFSRFMVVVSCVLAFAKAPAQQTLHEKTFRDWDKNKDGKLFRSELPQQVKRNFERVDADKSGFISLKEHVDFLTRNSNARNQNAKDWSGFKIIRDIRYAGTDHERQSLNLALPLKRKSDKPLPVIAYIHGGAWRGGNKNGGLNRLHEFLKSGEYVGVTIGYRLSQHAKWPAQIHDCKAAIRWIKANAKMYNLNGSRIAVHGTSAGGHLAAMLGTSAGVAKLDGLLGSYTEHSTTVRCVIDCFGPTNFLRMNDFEGRIDHDAVDSPESQLIGEAIQENKKLTLATNPISYVNKGDAPFLIMHGTKDMSVPYSQSEMLHKALNAAGVPSVFLSVKGGGHGGSGGVLVERFRTFLDHYLWNKEDVASGESIPVEKLGRR